MVLLGEKGLSPKSGKGSLPREGVVCPYKRHYTCDMIKTKDKKFQLRMLVADYKILKTLAAGENVPMSTYIVRLIRKDARRIGIPQKDIPGER